MVSASCCKRSTEKPAKSMDKCVAYLLKKELASNNPMSPYCPRHPFGPKPHPRQATLPLPPPHPGGLPHQLPDMGLLALNCHPLPTQVHASNAQETARVFDQTRGEGTRSMPQSHEKPRGRRKTHSFAAKLINLPLGSSTKCKLLVHFGYNPLFPRVWLF